jgi:hypothetical protein
MLTDKGCSGLNQRNLIASWTRLVLYSRLDSDDDVIYDDDDDQHGIDNDDDKKVFENLTQVHLTF